MSPASSRDLALAGGFRLVAVTGLLVAKVAGLRAGTRAGAAGSEFAVIIGMVSPGPGDVVAGAANPVTDADAGRGVAVTTCGSRAR